jgi:hypothetical protein
MHVYFGILSPVITMIFLYYYFKSSRVQRLRELMNKLFWVEELEENKALSFGARFTLIFYLFYIVNFTIYGVLTADLESLLLILLFAVGVPAVYRLIMSIQRFFYKI